MKNLGQMMKQAQEMQAKMAEMQEKLGQLEVTGQSGAGMVKATLNGKSELRRLKIERSLVDRSEEHTSELQSLMRISYAVFCLKKTTERKKKTQKNDHRAIIRCI